MPRPYLVGWGYAFKALIKSYRKSKIQRKFWRQLVKKKYYWLTDEERVESNKKCFEGIAELGKNMFPQKSNMEIILDYCDNVQTGDIDHLQRCIDVRNAMRNTKIDHKELLNRLDGSCPSSVGLDDYEGLCCGTADDNLSNQEKIDLCEQCWEKVLV